MSCTAHANIKECTNAFNKERRPFEVKDLQCPFLAVKTSIVSLRRDRADQAPFIAMRDMFETYHVAMCDCLSTRWIVAIMDTYAEFGSIMYARNAMLLSLFINQEKMGLTLRRRLFQRLPKSKKAEVKGVLWDGVTAMTDTKMAEVHLQMFGRLGYLLEDTPSIRYAFWIVLQRMVTRPNTTIPLLNTVSERHLIEDTLQSFLRGVELNHEGISEWNLGSR